jgi:TolA-binding protein
VKHLAVASVMLALATLVSPAAAQNRAEAQMLLELRTLQEQVQKLQLAMNQMAERVKANETLVETRANDMRKGFADQKVLIDSITSGLRTLNEREGEASVKVAQLNQEMKAIREGLSLQQTLLNEIIGLIQPLSGAATAAAAAGTTDPATGGMPPTTPATAQRPTTGIPPSPGEYYNAAFGYYYNGQWEAAVEALGEAIKKYPNFPLAARAQMTIGDAYYKWGKHFEEALAAYTATIANYKDPEILPDATFKLGNAYEGLGQIDAAVKSYQQVLALYPNSSMATFATQALRRLKIIK